MKKRNRTSSRFPLLPLVVSTLFVGILSFGIHALLYNVEIDSITDHSSAIVTDGEHSYRGSMLVASFDVPFADHFIGIRIEPNFQEGIRLLPYETIRLTSVGIFTTWEQQIQSNWYLLRHGNSKSAIQNCQGYDMCSFTAGNAAETLSIKAESGGKEDTVSVIVQNPDSKRFTDSIPDWASASVNALNSIGIIRGYADGRYGAADTLTQGQVITLIYRTLIHNNMVAEPMGCKQFSSYVPGDHYAFIPLCLFQRNGWDIDTNFDPNVSISRAETAAYIYVVFGEKLLQQQGILQGSIYASGQAFVDVPMTHRRFYEVGVANKTTIMTGNPDGTFAPERTLNRAEAAIIMYRLLQQL